MQKIETDGYLIFIEDGNIADKVHEPPNILRELILLK